MNGFRLRTQLAEAFGHVNQWYCSQAHGRRVDDREALLVHFIKSGGAADFAERYEQAMSPLNRWYCSEYYGRDVRDPETLWNYYTTCRLAGPGKRPTREQPYAGQANISIAS